ncbi:MAG: snoRNA-binding rRNA-processing protein utp10 [Peltula sp. TS41687]|nr:MAG: snoRNA-binding rRNA-processing protein utp10 [Peltula sp. TS41687]
MSTSLAQQLSRIATQSTHSLNLKAQKAAHSQSLIFDAGVATKQGFDSLYTLCIEGFDELCLLDQRFVEFRKTIFSEESKNQDRTHMTAGENEELDRVLEDFLALAGARLLLKPVIKAVEWLVRRFRVHQYNTAWLLLTFLPYHDTPIFRTILAVLPSSIPHTFRFLRPYVASLSNPPRHTIVYTLVNNHGFAAAFSNYILRLCKARQHYQALLTFWAGLMAEAVSGTLDLARSGRKGVQMQNEQDVMIRLLPVLNEGLDLKKVPELRLGCYMILIVLATKANLDDTVLTSMMEAVVAGWTTETVPDALVCLAVLAEIRESVTLPRKVLKRMMVVENLAAHLENLSYQYRVGKLALSLTLGTIEQLDDSGNSGELKFVEKMLSSKIFTPAQTTSVLSSLLVMADSMGTNSVGETESTTNTRAQLADILTRLYNSEPFKVLTMEALKKSGIDIESLELQLQTTIRVETSSKEDVKEIKMPDADSIPYQPDPLETALSRLPTRTVEVSFLSDKPSHIFGDVAHAFIMTLTSPAAIKRFSTTPVLRPELANRDPLFYSFFIRIWCGPYPAAARSAALRVVEKSLSDHKNTLADFQALIPYLMVALADPAGMVRQAAAGVVLSCSNIYQKAGNGKEKLKRLQPWAAEDIYGNSEASYKIDWMPPELCRTIITGLLVPGLEECILDSARISNLIQLALMKPSQAQAKNMRAETPNLKSSHRGAVLSYLASHAIITPLLTVKLGLVKMLSQVKKAGKLKGTNALLPLLQTWVSQKSAELSQRCDTEHVNLRELNDVIVGTVTSRNIEGLAALQAVINGEAGGSHLGLFTATLGHLRKIWPSLKEDLKVPIGQSLLKLTLKSSSLKSGTSGEEAREFLRSVDLSPEILAAFVEQLPGTEQLQQRTTPAKRRRVSRDQMVKISPQESKGAAAAVNEITYVLELVDSSKPTFHPTLMKGLFNILGELQQIRSQSGSEQAYLQSLILGSLLGMVNDLKGDASVKIDFTIMRTDLIVDCIRSTCNPQVQNAALLLVASLAEIAPDLVLHSVMPIFTFISSTVLRQDDDYSVYVIDQTIHRVIPPLVKSLKKRNQDPVVGTAELLLSFTAAFKHVPAHRQLQLFTSLLHTLGEDEFLFALLSMLADKYPGNDNVEAFVVELSGQYSPLTQLKTFSKILDLAIDVLAPSRTLSQELLAVKDENGQNIADIAIRLLSLLGRVSSSDTLSSRLVKSSDWEAPASQIQAAFSTLFEKFLGFERSIKNHERVHATCVEAMDSLLGLLSTKHYIQCVERLLERSSDELHWIILRALKSRLGRTSQADRNLLETIVGFIPRLTHTLENSSNVLVKHAAIACLDTIIEKYGKKNTEGVLSAVHAVTGSHGINHNDRRVQIIALLCLSSVVETLGPDAISLIPGALTIALNHLETSVAESEKTAGLHNAVYSFLDAIFVHLPWIITANYLDRILRLSHKSAEAGLDESANENRLHFLRTIVRQAAAKDYFTTLKRTMADAITAGPLATKEHLESLRMAIEKHPKSIIIKHAQALADALLEAFDLRRLHALEKSSKFTTEAVIEMEKTMHGIAIKMILKMNDTTFRPIFSKLIEWAATSVSKKEQRGRVLRLTTTYTLLDEFFTTLKSIVTSYASYIVDNVVDILTKMPLIDEESKTLWAIVLRTLHRCFEHDQDGFWQSPSHFNAIRNALLPQLDRASSMPVIDEVVPTIAELATAVESGDHHKDINAAILKYMRSDDTHVRLAAIKCEEALTEKLGEEWLALLPEMLPFISELQEDDDENVESETHRWIVQMEGILGESLDSMLQ